MSGQSGAAQLLLIDEPCPRVRLLTFNRPAKRNALSVALVGAIAEALENAEHDPEVGCVVLSGDAKAFSAGADINDQLTFGTEVVFAQARTNAWRTIERFPKPLIAAVNGYCLGGGCELALLCDVIVAGESARFGQPEVNIGIFPGDGATQRLPRVVGKSMAMKMILSGEPIDARTACDTGLVAEVVPDAEVVRRGLALAATIAEKSPIALRLAKECVLKAFETPLELGLAFEREQLALAFGTQDQREGMSAFLEKRAPRFRGR